MRNMFKRAKDKFTVDNNRAAKRAFLDELLSDVGRSQHYIYRVNFLRGIFFGLGSVLGGTVVLAIVVWILGMTGALIPGLADLIQQTTSIIESR